MDSSGAMRKKLSKGKRVVHDEDRFSKLPNLLVGRILSFLTVKEAVRTCVLSTRWIDAWKFITNMHLDDRWITSKTVNNNEHFANVVNRVINLNDNPTIENFSLLISSDKKYEPPQINAWLAGILEKNVQKLHIKYTAKEVIPSFFNLFCTTLEHMVLDMNCVLRVPTTICLPNLQSLELRKVVFLREFSTPTRDIIFSFPVLKVFEAHDCEWLENAYIDAPQLVNISFVTHERVSHKSTIKIFAAHIERFYFYGDLLNHNIIIEDSSSLLNCSAQIFLDIDYSSRMQELGFRACNFLKQFHEAGDLELGIDTVEILAYAKDLFAEIVPKFNMLDHLRVENFTTEMLLKFLQMAPYLETLTLNNVEHFDEGVMYSSTILPTSLQSNLEVVLLLGFEGKEHEKSLAKFILDNAEKLQQLVISTNWIWDSDSKLEEVREQILAYPKCSSNAKVDFIINVGGNFNPETSAYGNSILMEALGLM